jgi:hypothetical protein
MSDEQPRWPAGTPVDPATGAGGERFAPGNGNGGTQSAEISADYGAAARRLRVQRVVGQLVYVNTLFDVSHAMRVAGLDPTRAIQPGDIVTLLQEIERKVGYRPTSEDLVMWIAEDLGIEGDEFFTMLDNEGWQALQAQVENGDDFYTAIEELIGPPPQDAIDVLGGIMPAHLAPRVAEADVDRDIFWEPAYPDDAQMRQAFSHPRLTEQLDAGERVAMVIVTDRNGSILPDIEAEVYQQGEGERSFNIEPERFRSIMAESMPEGWRAAIRYEAYDHAADYHTVEVAGVLYAGDEYAGRFDLSFSDGEGEKIVNLNYLELEDRFQGHDAALSLMEGVVKHALDNDFARLEMLADITVGGYAWAKYGFSFATRTDQPRQFEPDKFRAWADNKGAEYQPAAGWVGLDRIKTPYDIATYDPDPTVRIPGSMIFNPNVDRDALLHPGKAYMLDMRGFGEWDAEVTPAHLYQLLQYKKAEALLRRDARKATQIIEMAPSAPRQDVVFEWRQRVQEDAGVVDLEDHFAISEEDIERALTALDGVQGRVKVDYDGFGNLLMAGKLGADAVVCWLCNAVLRSNPHNHNDPMAYHALAHLHVDLADVQDMRLLMRLARLAQDAGYSLLTFDAEGQIGRYAWARAGVAFQRQQEVREYNVHFSTWMLRHNIDTSARRYLHTPREFAAFDIPGVRVSGTLIDNPYVRKEALLPVGKAFMLDMRGMPAYLAGAAPATFIGALSAIATRKG